MLARNELLIKWALYAAATALCLLIQSALLQRLTIWGVLPFIYPLLAAIPATYEPGVPGTVFALCVGILCDLLLPEVMPCFYTLIFPLVGVCASALSLFLLPAGLFCSLTACAAAFLLTDGFRCVLLWMNGQDVWRTGLFLMLRELCVTLPLVLPVTILYRAVYRKVHIYD